MCMLKARRRIKKLVLRDPVGVPSSCCTTRQNASVVAQGCADFSSDSTDRNHSFTPAPRWASPSLRPGLNFRYTQVPHQPRFSDRKVFPGVKRRKPSLSVRNDVMRDGIVRWFDDDLFHFDGRFVILRLPYGDTPPPSDLRTHALDSHVAKLGVLLTLLVSRLPLRVVPPFL